MVMLSVSLYALASTLGTWALGFGALIFLVVWRLPRRIQRNFSTFLSVLVFLCVGLSFCGFALYPSWALLNPALLNLGQWTGLAFGLGVFVGLSNGYLETGGGHTIWILALGALSVCVQWELQTSWATILAFILATGAWCYSFNSFCRVLAPKPGIVSLGVVIFIAVAVCPNDIGRHWWNGLFPIILGIATVLAFWRAARPIRALSVLLGGALVVTGLVFLFPFPGSLGSVLTAAILSWMFWSAAMAGLHKEVT